MEELDMSFDEVEPSYWITNEAVQIDSDPQTNKIAQIKKKKIFFINISELWHCMRRCISS